VLGAVVHVQGAVQVVPEEDVAHLWLNGDVQEGKGGGPALLHIRKLRGKVIALTKSYTGLARCHNSHKIWQWQCGCPPPLKPFFRIKNGLKIYSNTELFIQKECYRWVTCFV